MRNRFSDFMNGRYGSDQLNRFLSILAMILIIIDLFTKVQFVYLLAIVLLVLVYLRAFSRNTSKRYAENEKYLQIVSKLTKGRFGGGNYGGYGGYGNYGGYSQNSYRGYQQNAYDRRAQREQNKNYKFFACPHCSQKVRVPKGKGKIQITCPKCRTDFIKRT